MIIRDTDLRICYIFAVNGKDRTDVEAVSAFLDKYCTEAVTYSAYSPFSCPVWKFETDDDYDFSLLMGALSTKFKDDLFCAFDEDDMCIGYQYWLGGEYYSEDMKLPKFEEERLESYI
jgi:hypothetical protein